MISEAEEDDVRWPVPHQDGCQAPEIKRSHSCATLQNLFVHILLKLLLVMCTCSILEHQGRNRLIGRHVVCFETVQNTSEEKLSCNIILTLFICIQSFIIAKNLPCNITISTLISKYNHLDNDLVQHQGLNSLKRSQKRLSAAGQKSCSHQGGVGVDAL